MAEGWQVRRVGLGEGCRGCSGGGRAAEMAGVAGAECAVGATGATGAANAEVQQRARRARREGADLEQRELAREDGEMQQRGAIRLRALGERVGELTRARVAAAADERLGGGGGARAHLGRAAVRNVQLQRRHAFADDVEDGRHAPAAHDLP